MKIAIISGTSGLIGMQLLDQLLKSAAYDFVISVGRRKLALKHPKLVQLEGDLAKIQDWNWAELINAESLGGDYRDLVLALGSKSAQVSGFCSLGTTIKNAGSKERFFEIDHDLVIAFASWVKSLGGQSFHYVSAMGANSESGIFYNQVKGKTEKDLESIGFESLKIYQPSLLLGNRHEFRFGELVASIVMRPLVWLKLFKNFRPIYDYQVAKSMVMVDLDSERSGLERISSGEMQDLTAKKKS
ncbi:oxidoreductase [Algoriphagus kandeliae]|uniref:Oxidoreductase n=1 Tax=Algoriphagus kandeliae TaxID=2562278 RepID=A0A4Y9QSU3_9BACT|nr:oxidoreductase [Algoriphagus kandeliae]TFV94203.1 oxidoreductase [Algoriphagus kandeliae]